MKYWTEKLKENYYWPAPSYAKVPRIIPEENATIIADYISADRIEVNLSDHYRRDMIHISKTYREQTFQTTQFRNL